MNFSKFTIGVETELDNLHFISWTQIQKISFLWLNSHQEKIARNGQNTLQG